MTKLFFCNIGWMNRYEGLRGKPDKIVGGGTYVDENGEGGEVCNFLPADDGTVYGYVETLKGDTDRQIRIENLQEDADEALHGIDVIWTATDPERRGRRVVGWYRDATVYRRRRKFDPLPSRQHRRDDLKNYHITSSVDNIHRLDLDERTLIMPRGPGWMGQTPWWTPPEVPQGQFAEFISDVRLLVDRRDKPGTSNGQKGGRGRSPSTAADGYSRYVETYEVYIPHRHHILQCSFRDFLRNTGVSDIKLDYNYVDLRYRTSTGKLVLAEIKPCDESSTRYAVRTAMGQLLDYRQRVQEPVKLLIVLEVEPPEEDKVLATSNGFEIAWRIDNKRWGFAKSPFR